MNKKGKELASERANDQAQADQIMRRYRDEMISVILRHGDVSLDRDFNIAAGDEVVLQRLKHGAVVVQVEAFDVKTYGTVLRTEWINANYRADPSFRAMQAQNDTLAEDDPVTVITLDLNTLRYLPNHVA